MYNVILKKQVKKFIKKLDKSSREGIIKRLKLLRENPRVGVPLQRNLRGLWKLRMGKYRAVYELNAKELIIYILTIGHRKKVYPK
jgi:mRNA interferase RelE/StbE